MRPWLAACLVVLAGCPRWYPYDRAHFTARCVTKATAAQCQCLLDQLEPRVSLAAVEDVVRDLEQGEAPDPDVLAAITAARSACGAP